MKALRKPPGNQPGNHFRNRLDDQLWYQLRNQLYYQLWNQLWDQLGSPLWNQLRNQLWDQQQALTRKPR